MNNLQYHDNDYLVEQLEDIKEATYQSLLSMAKEIGISYMRLTRLMKDPNRQDMRMNTRKKIVEFINKNKCRKVDNGN